jgi:cytochrome c-type biogenesis protein CcmF
MTLVAGMHFMIIARRQKYALFSAYLMILLTYILVLYATFLTRSGVLADTSAHSFGENGMTAQLLVFLLVFLVMMVVLIVFNFKKFNTTRKDVMASREFWMFLGSLILFLSAFQIIFTTSIPVVNSVLGTNFAPPTDAVGFYNRWQTPFALLIAAFIAITQFLNYQTNKPMHVIRKMAVPLFTAVIVCLFMVITGIVTRIDLTLLVFFILFGLLSALYNMIFTASRPVNIPAVITHAGFILFMLGVVITFSNSQVISSNTSRYDLGDNRSNEENLVLMRNDTLYMNGYYVSYVSDRKEGNTTHYRVDFLRKQGGRYTHAFSLHPSVNVHPRMGAVYNPDTRRFPDRDFYTYIAIVSKEPDYIVIKTIMNPYINVLWIGSLVMLAGFTYAFLRRARNRWVAAK